MFTSFAVRRGSLVPSTEFRISNGPTTERNSFATLQIACNHSRRHAAPVLRSPAEPSESSRSNVEPTCPDALATVQVLRLRVVAFAPSLQHDRIDAASLEFQGQSDPGGTCPNNTQVCIKNLSWLYVAGVANHVCVIQNAEARNMFDPKKARCSRVIYVRCVAERRKNTQRREQRQAKR